MGIKNCGHSIFMRLQKKTTQKQQTKNQLMFARKRFRSRKAILRPSKHVRLYILILRTPIIYYVTFYKRNQVTNRQNKKRQI